MAAVFQQRGYPNNYYFVKTWEEFTEVSNWMTRNNVKFLHESSSPMAIGFSIRKNFEWFSLRWL
jgi:ABC-type glycerol-3-phosphate transport system substrate-binding protein